MSGLTRDRSAEPVSRDQILRRKLNSPKTKSLRYFWMPFLLLFAPWCDDADGCDNADGCAGPHDYGK